MLVLAEHEAAADGVVGTFENALALVVDGGEEHPVGVEWQALAAVQDDVGVGVEGDLTAPGQGQPAGLTDPGHQRLGGHRVHGLRMLTAQPEHDRLTLPWPCPVAPSEPNNPPESAHRIPWRPVTR
jgi:hypothetical protein